MIDTPVRTLIVEELLRASELTAGQLDACIRLGRGVAIAKGTVTVELFRMYRRGEATRNGNYRRYRYSLVPTRSNLESILDAALRLDPEVARSVLEARGWRREQ